MKTTALLDVLGLGLVLDQLSREARTLLNQADIVAGGTRLLDALDIDPCRRLAFTTAEDFAERLGVLKQSKKICVVADGDPLIWGLGATLLRFFPRHELRFHPEISALQMAAARLGLPWADWALVSLHGRENLAPLFAALTHHRKVAVCTDPRHDPAFLARALVERGVRGWTMHVAEALCQPQEQVHSFGPDKLELAKKNTWHPLTLVVLEQTTAPDEVLTLGLGTNALLHDQGLITKQPVRALALSCLNLTPDARFWDLGAGSGAISLEAAALVRSGEIVAVERVPRRMEHIRKNLARFGAWMVRPVLADIETCIRTEESAPTHIFFGGGATPETLGLAMEALAPGGRMVIAAVLFSTLELVRKTLSWPMEIHQLYHAQAQALGPDLRLVPDNPVFLIATTKPKP